MKWKFALALAACVSAPQLYAQQSMPGMPGMQMPAEPMPQSQPRPQKNTQQLRPQSMPKDLPPGGNANAQKARSSMQASEAQQTSQAGVTPAPGSDFTSFSWDTLAVQEPESIDAAQQLAGHSAAPSAQPPAAGFLTGADMPAPELLGEMLTRPPMTVEQFTALADRRNPTIAEMQAAAARSRAQATQMHLNPDPVIGYSGDHIRGGSYHGGEEGAFISQDLVLWGKLGRRRDVYNSLARENEIGTDEQRARVHNSVEQAFYDALTMQAVAAVRQRLLKAAQDRSETEHELMNLGQADAADVLSSEVMLEQVRVDFTHAQRDFLAAFSVLTAYAGDGTMSPAPLQGQIAAPPAIDAQGAVTRVVTQAPAVLRAQQAVATAESRLKSAKREPAPDLNLKAGEWYSGEELGGTGGKRTGPMSFAEAGVRIPILNRNQGNTEAARVEVERARQDVTRTQLQLRMMAEPLAQEYLTSHADAERYRTQMLPRARRAYQLNVMKYQQMASPYAESLAAQRMVFQLQLDYLDALHHEWTSAISLRNFVLADGLAMPMDSGTHDTMLNLPGR